MSKIGKKPIAIPEGLQIEIKENKIIFKGKEGSFELPKMLFTHTEIKDKEILVSATENHKQAKANWGTMSALIRNAIHGVTTGFTKNLEIEGIGYRASMEGANLVLSVGFSHPVKFQPAAGVKVVVEKNVIKISGIDKALVGHTASDIRKIKKPEPYKGKGIRYQGEVVRRKAGKKAAGAGTKAA